MDFDPSGLVSKVALQIFHFICLAVTILLVVWQIYVYVQNNDVSRVGYEKFHSSASEIYPSVSLCFGDVLLQEKLIVGLRTHNGGYSYLQQLFLA